MPTIAFERLFNVIIARLDIIIIPITHAYYYYVFGVVINLHLWREDYILQIWSLANAFSAIRMHLRDIMFINVTGNEKYAV